MRRALHADALIALAVLVLFAGAFVGAALNGSPHDGDLDWQRWLGASVLALHRIPATLAAETFSAPGSPWIAQEWLFSVALALCTQAHATIVLQLTAAACAVATLLLVTMRARARGATGAAAASACALAGIALFESFGLRAQVLAWPFLALVVLLLERDDERVWYGVPAVVAWANLHASVALAPVLALACVRGAIRRRIALALALAIAACATPFGWHLIAYAGSVATGPMRAAIREWEPARLSDASFLLGGLPLAPLALAGIFRSRNRRDLALGAVALLMLFTAARNTATSAILLAPLAASGIDVLLRKLCQARGRGSEVRAPLRFAGAFALVCAAVGATLAGAIASHRYGPPAYVPPRAALGVLDAHSGEHHLFCEDFAWCSSALGSRRIKVYLDGRCDPYPATVWRDYVAIAGTAPAWRSMLDADRVDAVVAGPRRRLAKALARERGWRTIYRDADYVLFVRTAPERIGPAFERDDQPLHLAMIRTRR